MVSIMSGRSIVLGVLVPFVCLCALALWLTRPVPTPPTPVRAEESVPTLAPAPAPGEPQPPPPTAVQPSAPSPRNSAPPHSPRTFGEGSTLPSRSAPPPPITIPEAEPREEALSGTVDKEEVRQAIQRVVPLMRQCFQDVAERFPGSQSVTLKFTLEGQGPTGHFRDGEVVETTIQDPFTLACFLDSLLDIHFPAPRGGGRVTITYPFRFEHGADAGR